MQGESRVDQPWWILRGTAGGGEQHEALTGLPDHRGRGDRSVVIMLSGPLLSEEGMMVGGRCIQPERG